MDQSKPALGREYPCTIKLDNGTSMTLRLMTPRDSEGILAFARSLPEADLLFLRSDITNPVVVRNWVENIEEGRTVTLLAEVSGELSGYASLHYNETTWQRHLGEIRIQVGQRYRSQGLGKALAGEIFSIARNLGVRKIMAQMTPDQKGAIATFERLGFQPEALLQDFVIDRSGRTRDLVIMANDVTGLSDNVESR
ncbi:MAG: GNAT family N-acetyltransferase [Dehalococcoidia bacterium]